MAAALAVAVPVAGAAKTPPVSKRPLSIVSASLTQSGQQLVWKVDLNDRFSPGALTQARRSLCLLFERPGNGSVAGSTVRRAAGQEGR